MYCGCLDERPRVGGGIRPRCPNSVLSGVRTNLYIKVELDYEKEDDPVRIAAEIVRQIRKNYNVRMAEVSSLATDE